MSHTVRFLGPEYEAAWHELLAQKSGVGFYQSFPFVQFKRVFQWKAFQVGLFEGERLVGGAMIFQFFVKKNKSFLYIPQGPVVDYDDEERGKVQWDMLLHFCQEIHRQHPQDGLEFLRVEPQLLAKSSFLDERWKKSTWNDLPKSTVVVDLTQSLEAIEEARSAKCRYNIRLAEKKGVEVEDVEQVQAADLEEFYKLYALTAERNEFTQKPRRVFETLLRTCGPLLRLFVARANGETLAAALVVCFGGTVTYFYGASHPQHRAFMAPHLLHSEIIRWAKSQGYLRYDFWGISPLHAKNHPWAGITRFKLQFGGERKDYGGAYDFSFIPEGTRLRE